MDFIQRTSLFQGLMHIVSTGNDLTSRQVMVLLLIAIEPRRLKDMATQLNVGVPAISRAADRLESEEYGRRAADPEDRRSILLRITPAGKQLIDAALTVAQKEMAA